MTGTFVEHVLVPGLGDQVVLPKDPVDLLNLGQTVPAEAMRWPDPDCVDCWGEGRVCGCHGFAASYQHGRTKPLEQCPCRHRGKW